MQGSQRSAAHLELNLQDLVPVLETEGAALTQSLAMIEYLDKRYPQPKCTHWAICGCSAG